MSKKVIILGTVGLLALGGAAFTIVATAGVPKPIDISLRGKDEYYVSDLLTYDLPEIVTNLRGAGGKFIKILVTAEYRIGPELEPAAAAQLFVSQEAKLQDRFIMLISAKTMADVETREHKKLLQEELKDLIQSVVFPEQLGRVEGILYRDFKIQG
jgi:flagellar basal body-associated protein FliL